MPGAPFSRGGPNPLVHPRAVDRRLRGYDVDVRGYGVDVRGRGGAAYEGSHPPIKIRPKRRNLQTVHPANIIHIWSSSH
eukprot:6315804-Pyramimonas_sp.AAC.1